MGKKQAASATSSRPRSFGGLLRGHAKSVREIAEALRDLVYEELPDAEETFYGGRHAMAMYRTTADICWIQPLKQRCNVYFMCGAKLSDDEQLLEGSSQRQRHAKVRSLDDVEQLPLRAWLQESVALSEAAFQSGMSFQQVLKKLRKIGLALPNTTETLTWGKPHFRVGEKIFCGCGEDQGRPKLGLKMEAYESEVMMKLPGIEKAPYSRKGDGWVSIDPNVFDDWDEIQRLIVGSYRLIAPKRIVAQLDAGRQEPGASRHRRTAKRSR